MAVDPPLTAKEQSDIQQASLLAMREFLSSKKAGTKLYAYVAGSHREKVESMQIVKKRIKAGDLPGSNMPKDYVYDRIIIHTSNSVDVVDAVEKICQKVALNDVDLNEFINLVAGAGTSIGYTGDDKMFKWDGSKRSLTEYLASDQSKYDRVVGLTSVTPI